MSPQHFSVLYDKAVAVESVSLCPKMDLIAIVTVDGSLVLLRTMSWQKLHSISAPDLQNKRLTAMCWSPDGTAMALGHKDGSLSLLDVDKGEVVPQPFALDQDSQEGVAGAGAAVVSLVWTNQHSSAASESALDAEKDHANELSRHYRERDHRLLEDLPALQQPGGTFAAVQDSGGQGGLQHKLQSSSRGLDVLVLAHEDGRVVLLLSGLFPVLHVDLSSYLPPQQHPPSSASSSSVGQLSPSRPSICSVCATGDLSALLFAVQQQPTMGSSSSSSLVTVRTPSLWRYRHEVAPLADMFSSLSALVGHVHDAIDLAEKQWKESIKVLEIKLGMLQDLLTNYGCRASPREAFLGLVLSGVPTPALAQYMSQNGSEPQQQNLFRQSKAIDEKCANLEALLRDQIGRAAEMITFQASKLRGMASVGDEYQEVGLSMGPVAAFLEAAAQLGLKAEDALKEVQQARQNLKVLLLWLIDVMQHIASGAGPATTRDKLTFKNSSKHVRLLLSFLRRKPVSGPEASKPSGHTEGIIGTHVSAYFRDEPLPPHRPAPTRRAASSSSSTGESDEGASAEKDKQLRDLSLRQVAEQVRSLFTSVFRGPSQALGHMPLSAHVLQLENTTDHALAPSAEQQQQDRSASPALHVRQAAPHSALLALSSPGRVWVLNIDTQAGSTSGSKASEGRGPSVEVACLHLPAPFAAHQLAIYGGLPSIPSSNDEALAVLARSSSSSLELWKLPIADLSFVPVPPSVMGPAMTALASSSSAEGRPMPSAPTASLLSSLLRWEASAAPEPPLPAQTLSECYGMKKREVGRPFRGSEQLAVTGARGVGCVFSQSHRLVILDMEEDEEEEDEEEEGEGSDRDGGGDDEEDGMAVDVAEDDEGVDGDN